jgi:hypothetical protein
VRKILGTEDEGASRRDEMASEQSTSLFAWTQLRACLIAQAQGLKLFELSMESQGSIHCAGQTHAATMK